MQMNDGAGGNSHTELAEQFTKELLACGLSASDFRLAKPIFGGGPLLVWNIPLEAQLAHAEKLAEHFHVNIHYNGRNPTAMLVKLPGEEPAISEGSPIVYRYAKGIHTQQIKSRDMCERCQQQKKPVELITIEYSQIDLLLCFPCCKTVLSALMKLPLEERASRLETLQQRWKEQAESQVNV